MLWMIVLSLKIYLLLELYYLQVHLFCKILFYIFSFLSYVIYNSLGIEVLTDEINSNSFETNLLLSGVYYLQLRGAIKSPFQKLIIQK